jgi:hypothetical protein
MALAAQAGNDNTVLQGSTAHNNNCGGYKEQVAIVLTTISGVKSRLAIICTVTYIAQVTMGIKFKLHQRYIDVALSLKGHPIPTDGSGACHVVIFDDIGGYLGPADGLLCSTNSSSFIAQYTGPSRMELIILQTYQAIMCLVLLLWFAAHLEHK